MTRNVSIWWLWPPKSQEWKLQVEGEGTFTWKAGEESCWWQWHRGCDSILFQPYTFSARTDVSTRASGLIIVPRRKCVCVCVFQIVFVLLWSVCQCLEHEFDQKAFFVLSSSVCLEFGIMEQNSLTKVCRDFSTLAQAKLWQQRQFAMCMCSRLVCECVLCERNLED